MRLIVATRNPHKFREIKKLLRGLDIELVYLKKLDENIKIKETGVSFFENAQKKAVTVSKRYKADYIVGEDSGLEVKYLRGSPGIFSKRYSGKNSTYLKNNQKLLRELSGAKKKDRVAHFRCVIALVKSSKLIKKFEGTLKGIINDEIRGRGGFGYDPVFYLPHYKKTVAQLPLKEKNRISHRAKAFLALKKFLADYLENK